jgi:hypothetical protein
VHVTIYWAYVASGHKSNVRCRWKICPMKHICWFKCVTLTLTLEIFTLIIL